MGRVKVQMECVRTDHWLPGVLPPKDPTGGVDFLKIFDEFDPSALPDELLQKFARTRATLTQEGARELLYLMDGETYRVPFISFMDRYLCALDNITIGRRFIEDAVRELEIAPSKRRYTSTRNTLEEGIWDKLCLEILQRRFDRMSKKDFDKDSEDWERWTEYCMDHPGWQYVIFYSQKDLKCLKKGCEDQYIKVTPDPPNFFYIKGVYEVAMMFKWHLETKPWPRRAKRKRRPRKLPENPYLLERPKMPEGYVPPKEEPERTGSKGDNPYALERPEIPQKRSYPPVETEPMYARDEYAGFRGRKPWWT